MATIHADRSKGRSMHKNKREVLTKHGYQEIDRDIKLDGDGETGVDPQVEQLNDMPNDSTDMPKEKKD